MTWWTIGLGCGVLEIDYRPTSAVAKGELPADIELLVYWGDGQTRAVWLWSQTGRVAWWSGVGEA